MLACSFLIESLSKLLVTRGGIKLCRVRFWAESDDPFLELLAPEWQKFHTFELEYLWSQWTNLDQILCVASLGWGKGYIRFWGRLTLAQVSDRCPLGYLSKIFFSKTAGRIKAKFHMEPQWDGGTKVCSQGLDHMTKMAPMPIYGKNPSKIFFSTTKRPMTLWLGM